MLVLLCLLSVSANPEQSVQGLIDQFYADPTPRERDALLERIANDGWDSPLAGRFFLKVARDKEHVQVRHRQFAIEELQVREASEVVRIVMDELKDSAGKLDQIGQTEIYDACLRSLERMPKSARKTISFVDDLRYGKGMVGTPINVKWAKERADKAYAKLRLSVELRREAANNKRTKTREHRRSVSAP